MKKDIENFYKDFDEKLEKIEKRLKRSSEGLETQPIIFNYDEVSFLY